MGTVLQLLNPMFRTRLIQLRKARNLTQQALAEAMPIHVNQIKRYEAGTSEPTMEGLIRLARALHVSLDDLVFDESERRPSDELALQFEAISQMSEDERAIVVAVLDSLILKHQARRWTGSPHLRETPGNTSSKSESQHP